MLRKFVAVSLVISFLAMASSGLMMFIIEKPSFTIQMHPVHKLFGLVMIVSVIIHLVLNYRSLLSYLKTKSVVIYGGLLTVMLVFLYAVTINNQLPDDLANQMDSAAVQVEQRR